MAGLQILHLYPLFCNNEALVLFSQKEEIIASIGYKPKCLGSSRKIKIAFI